MRNIFFVIMSLFIGNILYSQDIKNYKNQRLGYEFNYPNSWYLVSELESNDEDITIPLEDSTAIVAYMSKEERARCSAYENCLLSVNILGDGTEVGYKKVIEHVNKFQINKSAANTAKQRLQIEMLNGNKMDLLVRERGRNSFQGKAYIYCKDVKYLATFSTSIDRQKKGNMVSDEKIKISLETLFTVDQQLIIKSFKCPLLLKTNKK